VTQCASHRS